MAGRGRGRGVNPHLLVVGANVPVVGARPHLMAMGANNHVPVVGAKPHLMSMGANNHVPVVGAKPHLLAVGANNHVPPVLAKQQESGANGGAKPHLMSMGVKNPVPVKQESEGNEKAKPHLVAVGANNPVPVKQQESELELSEANENEDPGDPVHSSGPHRTVRFHTRSADPEGVGEEIFTALSGLHNAAGPNGWTLGNRFVPVMRLVDTKKSYTAVGYDAVSLAKVIIYVQHAVGPGFQHVSLQRELEFYNRLVGADKGWRSLSKNVGFPALLGENIGANFGVMDQFIAYAREGISLQGIHRQRSREQVEKALPREGFPIRHLLKIASGALELLQYVHKRGLIHRNIHPDQFILKRSLDDEDYVLYLTSFQGMTEYKDQNGQHIENQSIPEKNHPISRHTARSFCTGTAESRTFSRKDDLEQLAYMLIDLRRKVLPWLVPANKKLMLRELHYAMKKHRLDKSLNALLKPKWEYPKIFKKFLVYCRELEFEQEPNYAEWIKGFQDELLKLAK